MNVIRDNMAPLMFVGMIGFMLFGYPAAFSLAATGLFFGFIGIEYEGGRMSEPEGIRATKSLLESLRGSTYQPAP